MSGARLRRINADYQVVLRYELIEPEHGVAHATVICMPGIEDTPGELGPIPKGLAQAGYRVVVAHPRGGRYSDPVRGLWSMRTLARDVRSLIEELGDVRSVSSV